MVRPNLSDIRRATIQSYLDGERDNITGLEPEPLTALVVGLLICDDTGRFSQSDLLAAMNDRSIVQLANHMLREAGY